MVLRVAVAGLWWKGIFRFAERRTFSGCSVGIFLPQTVDRPLFEQKCSVAFELVRLHGPRHFARLGKLCDGVLVFGDTGPLAEWVQSARLITLGQHFLLRPGTQPADVAAAIVHEITHAWLDHLGFEYTVHRRRRIEAICYRSQAAFARRLPGGEELAADCEACADAVLLQTEAEWSEHVFRLRAIAQLRELGTPEWLVRAVSGITTMLHNER